MSALFPVPFGQGSAPFFTHPSSYARRLVQLLSSYAQPKRLFARSSSPLVLGPVPADYPPRYLIRLYVQLGAHVREEPVPTPWCPNSTLGRFSSRHPPPPNRASTGMRQIKLGRRKPACLYSSPLGPSSVSDRSSLLSRRTGSGLSSCRFLKALILFPATGIAILVPSSSAR